MKRTNVIIRLRKLCPVDEIEEFKVYLEDMLSKNHLDYLDYEIVEVSE